MCSVGWNKTKEEGLHYITCANNTALCVQHMSETQIQAGWTSTTEVKTPARYPGQANDTLNSIILIIMPLPTK